MWWNIFLVKCNFMSLILLKSCPFFRTNSSIALAFIDDTIELFTILRVTDLYRYDAFEISAFNELLPLQLSVTHAAIFIYELFHYFLPLMYRPSNVVLRRQPCCIVLKWMVLRFTDSVGSKIFTAMSRSYCKTIQRMMKTREERKESKETHASRVKRK